MSSPLALALSEAWEKAIRLEATATRRRETVWDLKNGSRFVFEGCAVEGAIGTWRGDRYALLWNWRTGATEWRRLDAV